MDDFDAEVEATIARWHGIIRAERSGAADGGRPDLDHPRLRGAARHAGVRGRTVQLRGRAARDEGVSAMTDLADLSLVEAADAVRNGDATSMELLDACWRNMEAANPKLNATIWLDREGAEQAARAADRGGAREGLARPAARRADDAQGHVLPGGQAQHLRLGAAPRLASRGHRHRDREAERGRRLRRSAASTWRSSRRTRPVTIARSATATIRGTRPTSPAARRPGPAPRWRRGSTTWRWVPTPAVRSACRRRRAASPASSRRRPACRASA